MSKGKTKTVYLHREGLVTHQNAPDYGFIYEVSSVKSDKWDIGDVVELGNGKGFVYCKSGGICITGVGNALVNAIPATGIDYSVLYAAAAKGDTSIQMTNQGIVAQTLDGLRGGHITMIPVAGTITNLQQRGIIGNTAGGVSDVITIYLDAPLTAALTTSSYAFCMPSPYCNVQHRNDETVGKAVSRVGPAAVYVSAANMYFWCQFKGRCWIASSTAGTLDYGREVVWNYNGGVVLRGTTISTYLNGQIAGYIVDNNVAQNGATEIMLTGNV